MENNNKTAVEWLIEQLKLHETGEAEWMSESSTIHRALRMEKEQEQLARKESYNEGWLEATQYIFKKYKKQ